MKIRDIEAFQVSWSPDDTPHQRSAFVRIQTDDGHNGIGEASPMQGVDAPESHGQRGGWCRIDTSVAYAVPVFARRGSRWTPPNASRSAAGGSR